MRSLGLRAWLAGGQAQAGAEEVGRVSAGPAGNPCSSRVCLLVPSATDSILTPKLGSLVSKKGTSLTGS